ncbi:DUF1024 family protein [Streptomyces sp. RFCAC02]|uniref:DUF1024 family protein n=1 Tax=Streptomyces sp. RFCAC02 TaxID=2499143 RepID=UPI00143D700E|nr:DUF1024 family protein [Streptomyces sp. RFCAC02]
MFDEVKLTPDEAMKVMQAIAAGQQEMASVAQVIESQSVETASVYRGQGTVTAVQNYEDLSKGGQALGTVLEHLANDVRTATQTGEQGSVDAANAVRATEVRNINPDTSIIASV